LAENTTHITDPELLDRFYADHDNQWLGILFQRYTLLLYGVCMKYLKNEEEAKDAVQQVFLKAITELRKYKVQYFKSWIYMVAKNHCLMKLRDRPGRFPVEVKEDQLSDNTDPSVPAPHIEKDKQLSMLTECLRSLAAEQQECVTLFYLQKKSYQEISETTGYTAMQVKSYIQNGKRNLRLLMEKKSKHNPS